MRYFPFLDIGFPVLLLVGACALCPEDARSEVNHQNEGLIGRWDLTLLNEHDLNASWLEIVRDHDKLMGRVVWRIGGALPIENVRVTENHFSFTVSFSGKDLVVKGQLVADRLEGTTDGDNPTSMKWVGVRSPALMPIQKPQWGVPVQLFNGHDLHGWDQRNQRPGQPWRFIRRLRGACWRGENGVLINQYPCSDLLTKQTFRDFKLHLEFRIMEEGSGVFLRGRYEVQIQDDAGKRPEQHGTGSVYGFLVPTSNPAKPRGEWQTLDVTLLGRYVTVMLNGRTVIDEQEIPGITGGALDSHEEDPGPLMLQGDHGQVAFRNIVLTPVKQ